MEPIRCDQGKPLVGHGTAAQAKATRFFGLIGRNGYFDSCRLSGRKETNRSERAPIAPAIIRFEYVSASQAGWF